MSKTDDEGSSPGSGDPQQSLAASSPPSPVIRLARVLGGAKPFKEGNINDTYRGQIELADGTVIGAVIKDIEAKELANELFAADLATRLSLPVPPAYLAVVDPAELAVSKAPRNADGERLVFASADVAVPNVFVRYTSDVSAGDALFSTLCAWPDLGRLYGFDAWVANIDRHAGNLLFGSGGDAWLIDHGWALTGPNWTIASLNPGAEYRHKLSEWLTDRLTDGGKAMRAKQAAGLESELHAIDLLDAIKASSADLLLTDTDSAAALEFLAKRVGKVAFYSNKALKVPTMV